MGVKIGSWAPWEGQKPPIVFVEARLLTDAH